MTASKSKCVGGPTRAWMEPMPLFSSVGRFTECDLSRSSSHLVQDVPHHTQSSRQGLSHSDVAPGLWQCPYSLKCLRGTRMKILLDFWDGFQVGVLGTYSSTRVDQAQIHKLGWSDWKFKDVGARVVSYEGRYCSDPCYHYSGSDRWRCWASLAG